MCIVLQNLVLNSYWEDNTYFLHLNAFPWTFPCTTFHPLWLTMKQNRWSANNISKPISYRRQNNNKRQLRGKCGEIAKSESRARRGTRETRTSRALSSHKPRVRLRSPEKNTQNKRSPLNKVVGCNSSQHLRYVPSSVEHQLFPMSFISDQSKRFWRLTGRCGPGGGLPVSDCVRSSLYFLGGFIRVGGATLIGFGSLEAEIQSTCSSKTYMSNF